MSELKIPLIPSATNPDKNALNGASNNENLPNETQGAALTKKMRQICSSIRNNFAAQAYEFKKPCIKVLFSSVHNHFLALQEENTLEIKPFDRTIESTTKKIELESNIDGLKFSLDEKFIFFTDDASNIFRYSYPDLDESTKVEFKLQSDFSDSIFFDVCSLNGIVYACNFEWDFIYRLNFNNSEMKLIGRNSSISFLRVSYNGSLVGVVCEDDNNSIVVYSRKYNWKQFVYKVKKPETEEEKDDEGVVFEFTRDSKRMSIVYENYIELWNIFKGELERTFKFPAETNLNSVKFCEDDEFLACMDSESNIYIWNTQNEVTPKFQNRLQKDQKQTQEKNLGYGILQVAESKNFIFTHKNNSKFVYSWKSVFLEKSELSNEVKDVKHLLYFKVKNEIIAVTQSEIHFLDENSGETLRSLAFELDDCSGACFNGDSQTVLYLAGDKVVLQFDLVEFKELDEIKLEKLGKILAITSNGDYLASGGSYNILSLKQNNTFQEKDLKLIEENAETNSITYLSFINLSLVVGNNKGTAFVFSLPDLQLTQKYSKHTSSIRSIHFIAESNLILSIADDKKCQFSSLSDKSDLKTKELTFDVEYCSISNDGRNCLICTTTGIIMLYNLPGFDKVFEYRFKSLKTSKVQSKYKVSASSENLFISNSQGIFKMHSPLSSEMTIVSDAIDIPNILEFLSNRKKSVPLKDETWVILPQTFSCMHYYAFVEQTKELKAAMNNNIKYLNSSLGYPLHVALAKKNSQVCETILSQLKKRLKADPYIFYHLEDIIIELNNAGFNQLTDVYNEMFIKVEDRALPDMIMDTVSLPIIKYLPSPDIAIENFIPKAEEEKEPSVRIQFFSSAIRLNLEPGSDDSRDFLKSLSKCSNTNIFKTKFVKTILSDKWNQVKWVMLLNQSVFLFYLIAFSVYLIARDPYSLIISFALNVGLAFYEFYQLSMDVKEYLTSVWNYIDFSRAGFLCYYAIIVLVNLEYNANGSTTEAFKQETEDKFWLVFIITILSWIRGISIFALFPKTRYMISLIVEVLKDIVSFAIIVLYSILAFAFLKLSLTGTAIDNYSFESISNILHLVFLSYFDALGSFNPDSENKIEQALIILNTIFNVIIMMNLLISILGTTYGRVNDDSEVEDQKRLIDLILEVESLMFRRKGNKTKSFVQLCEENSETSVLANPMITKLKNLKKSTLDLNKNHSSLLEISKSISKSQSDSALKLDQLRKTFISEITKVKNEIKDINKDSTSEEKKEENPFKCLKGHDLKIQYVEGHYCDICRTEITDEKTLSCQSCDFDLCLKCAEFYFEHTREPTKIQCLSGHIMLTIEDGPEYFKEKEFVRQNCRYCNKGLTKKILHCIPCMYSICLSCKSIVDKFFEAKTKANCEGRHVLSWKTAELYLGKERCAIKCTNCGKGDKSDTFNYKVGSGFFCCLECNEYFCPECFKDVHMKGEFNVEDAEHGEGEKEETGPGEEFERESESECDDVEENVEDDYSGEYYDSYGENESEDEDSEENGFGSEEDS